MATLTRAVATKQPSSEKHTKDSSKRAKKKALKPNVNGVILPEDLKKSTGDEKIFQRLWNEAELKVLGVCM